MKIYNYFDHISIDTILTLADQGYTFQINDGHVESIELKQNEEVTPND